MHQTQHSRIQQFGLISPGVTLIHELRHHPPLTLVRSITFIVNNMFQSHNNLNNNRRNTQRLSAHQTSCNNHRFQSQTRAHSLTQSYQPSHQQSQSRHNPSKQGHWISNHEITTSKSYQDMIKRRQSFQTHTNSFIAIENDYQHNQARLISLEARIKEAENKLHECTSENLILKRETIELQDKVMALQNELTKKNDKICELQSLTLQAQVSKKEASVKYDSKHKAKKMYESTVNKENIQNTTENNEQLKAQLTTVHIKSTQDAEVSNHGGTL